MISFSSLLKKALDIYFPNFKLIFSLLSVFLIWNLAINTIPVNIATTIKFMIPTGIASLIISALTQLALVKVFAGASTGKLQNAIAISKETLKRSPAFVAILFLLLITIIIGIIFLIFPAIIFSTWFLFVMPVFAVEHTSIIGTFKRSKYLVSGYFFPVLWRMALIFFIIMFITGMAAEGLKGIIQSFNPKDTLPYLMIIINTFTVLLSAFFIPIIAGTTVTLYYELRRLKNEV